MPMTTNVDDDGVRAVRDIREKISRECENDAEALVAHYVVVQERYRGRVFRPARAQPSDADGSAERDRR